MPSGFKSINTDLDNIFLSDFSLLEQFSKYSIVEAWGENTYGQLGDGTTTNRTLPVRLSAVSVVLAYEQVSTSQGVSAGITGVPPLGIAAQAGGRLFCWGRNDIGQLGDNTTTNRSSPVQTVAGGSVWRTVSVSYQGCHAIKTDGTLWGWGNNLLGQLGDNSIINKSSPVQTVAGGNDWKQVTHAENSTIALKADGTLWTWGSNANGLLGDGTTINRSSPVQTIAGGSTWKSINTSSVGEGHVVAIKTDGTMWAWGRNDSGQLGDGTTISKSSPVQIFNTVRGWRSVSHSNHTLAIKFDGSLWGWGTNTSGQLGDNTTVSKSSIVQTVSNGYDWKQCVAGGSSSIALKKDGTLWHWGATITGNFSSPVQLVSGSSGWRQVSGDSNAGALGIFVNNRQPPGTPTLIN